MVVMHEGYRIPGYIRGQFFSIADDGEILVDEEKGNGMREEGSKCVCGKRLRRSALLR